MKCLFDVRTKFPDGNEVRCYIAEGRCSPGFYFFLTFFVLAAAFFCSSVQSENKKDFS
jgi:hypothetical protein